MMYKALLLLLAASFPTTIIAQSAIMQEVGRVQLPGQGSIDEHRRVSLHVHGDYAYLAETYGPYQTIRRRVWIYDVSNKSSMPLIANMHLVHAGDIHDIWYANDYLYTAHRGGGINMFDVKNPKIPALKEYRNDGYIHKGLITSFDGKYLLSGKGFAIYDISNGYLNKPIGNEDLVGDGWEVVMTQTSDGHMYAYRCTSFTKGAPIGIYDITDPTNPIKVNEFNARPGVYPPWEMEVSPDGKYLYTQKYDLFDTGEGPKIEGGGFQVFDLTDPVVPRLLSSVDHKHVQEISLDFEHKILYTKDHWDSPHSVYAFDVSDPTNPRKIGNKYFPRIRKEQDGRELDQWGDLWYSDGYIYTIHNNDLVVLQGFVPPILKNFQVTPSSPIAVGTEAMFSCSCSDQNPGDTHTLKLDPLGDGSYPIDGSIIVCDGSEKLITTYIYLTVGVFEASVTVTDQHGYSSARKSVTVKINGPPVVTSFTAPPSPVNVDTQMTFIARCTDPNQNPPDTHTYTLDLGDGSDPVEGSIVCDRSDKSITGTAFVYNTAGAFDASLTITDDHGLSSASETAEVRINGPPVVTSFKVPSLPISVGTEMSLTGQCTDPNPTDTHTYALDLGDGSALIKEAIVCDDTEQSLLPSTYNTAGVFQATLTITDHNGLDDSMTKMVVVYDPSAGFVTGGGEFYSRESFYKPDESLDGMATFGFVSRYKKGAEIPSGNTNFEFEAGSLSFHSTSFDWLVVTGSNYAKFKGTGNINNENMPLKFMVWAGANEHPAKDTFTIKIWEEDAQANEVVVYKNERDQEIEGGQVKIHTGRSPKDSGRHRNLRHSDVDQ